MTKDDGVVNIHGKKYLTVARRINDFRQITLSMGFTQRFYLLMMLLWCVGLIMMVPMGVRYQAA